MFGYDRDPGMMLVLIDEPLYKQFSDISVTNNSIISQIEHGIEHIKLSYPEGLHLTRASVLDKNIVFMLSSGTNCFPFNPENNTIKDLDGLLEPFIETMPTYK